MVLALVSGLTYIGFRAYQGEMHAAVVRAYVTTDSLTALRYNVASYKAYPYSQWIRRQFILTLAKLVHDHVSEGQVKLSEDAMHRMLEITASTGPAAPHLLMVEMEMLSNYRQAKKNPERMERGLAMLKRNSRRHIGTWVIEAFWARTIGDIPRAKAAVKAGLALHGPYAEGTMRDQLTKLGKTL